MPLLCVGVPRLLRRYIYGGTCAMLLFLGGCGLNSSSGGYPPGNPTSIVSVSISGASYTEAGVCTNFVATVSGTGNYDSSVQWFVNGSLGGSAFDGLITSSGTYCAPEQPPSTNPVAIKTVSRSDSSKFAITSTRVVAITISPRQPQVYTGDSQQFSVVVAGAISNSVEWEVNGIIGGSSSTGTVSSSGLYTAPVQTTTVAISLEAVLAEATSIFASTNLIISARIVISPQNPNLTYGSTQQFVGTINGTPAQVNWGATYGSITSSGLYTASGTQSPDTVRAWTSNATGSTTVQIVGLAPTITSISPQPATALDQITITGTNLYPVATVVFSDAIGGELPVSGPTVVANNSGTSLTLTVPQGVVSGPFFVMTQQGTLTPVKSNTLQFQRLARVRIRVPRKDLSSGESETFQYALLGDNTPRAVTFSADLGSFNGSTYQAPTMLAANTFAHITGCVSGTQTCDTMILGLHPFRIAPDVPEVEVGQSLQLSAVLGGATTGANWSLLAGGGSLNASGLYSAGNDEATGGPAIISATANGATEQTSLGVTGAFPGLLNRINDYFDEHQPNAPGTFASGATIVGNRMYVSATNHIGAYSDSYYWIDIYDLTDPLQPVWLTAVEANSSGPVFATGQYLYSYQNADIAVPGYPNTITIYQLQNQVPVLKARTTVPQWWSISDNQGLLTLTLFRNALTGSAEMQIYDLTSGTIASRDLNILLPPDANNFVPDNAITVGNRLFVSVATNDLNLGGYLLTYELSASPPVLLGEVNGRSLEFYSSGTFLFGALGGMDIYDIAGQLPQVLSHVDGVNAVQLRGTQMLARTAQQGFWMLDISDPRMPRQTSVLFDGVIANLNSGQLYGDYVYEAQSDGGVAVFDAKRAGGPASQYFLFGGPHLSAAANDLLLQSPYLYAATATFDGAVLSIYDTTANPVQSVAEYVDTSQQALSVESAGNYVYLGMTRNMGVLDLSQPTSPSLVETVPVVATSLAKSGNTLFAGTSAGSLVVMDISNPAQPLTRLATTLPDPPLKLRISNNLLLIADGPGGLLIYDVSSPMSPVLLSQTTALTSVNDVVVSGSTAFAAADVDGLGIVDISNPAHPVLISKTSLSRIDPFSNLAPLNEASAIGLHNGLVYVGTLNDNGLVFGLDCTNLAVPRIVSKYAYGGFVLTTVNSLLFNGEELLIGGSLNDGPYPVAAVDVSNPFDSIEEFFPPLALQNPAPLATAQAVISRKYGSAQRMPRNPGPNTSDCPPRFVPKSLCSSALPRLRLTN